jgi:hypothetical protein
MGFMRQGTFPAVDLRSFDHYIAACLALAQEKLSGCTTMAQVKERQSQVNLYPDLAHLGPPHQVHILDEDAAPPALVQRAKEAVAQGLVLFEHAAAGEGTRLQLGSKYFLDLSRDLTVDSIAHHQSREAGRHISPDEVRVDLDCAPQELARLSLGSRHMLQLAYDLAALAQELGESPGEVLGRQHLLIVMADDMLAHIERDFYQWHFYGFNPAQVFFMMQRSFHGLGLNQGRFFYDPASPKRLHNHGQMVMQETMDRQLFTLTGAHVWEKKYHAREAVADWLARFADKISYNIEDLDYLTGSLDFPGQGLALEFGSQGCHMVMEVVANNPIKPQKGGMLAWDPALERDVMIESFQLGDLPNEEIKFLNRNFNHYPRPAECWRRLGEAGLPMPIAVKDGHLYFQPVQGDINFLVRTAFFRRKQMRPIRNLKSPATLPLAINRMYAQDRQPGFQAFAARCRQGEL